MVCVALSHVAANSKAGKSRIIRGGLRRETGDKLVHEEQVTGCLLSLPLRG